MKEFTPEQISALTSFVEPDRFSTGQSNRELHLHDMDDEISHLVPGDGSIDFTNFEEFLVADDTWTTIEVRPSHLAGRSRDWLINMRNEINVKQQGNIR